MAFNVSPAQRSSFYEAAFVGLHALENAERTGRRFGPDADARWESFRGHLGTTDRLDLLLRDAAVKWRGAFSPAIVFDLPGLAADEPFGPDWASLPEHEAARLWTSDEGPASIDSVAEALGVSRQSVELPVISASTRLAVAGGSAVVEVADYFSQHADLSWPDQVLVVAGKPEHRHLAGLMAPIIFATGPTRMVLPVDDVKAALEKADFLPGGTRVTSADASNKSLSFVGQATTGG